MKFVTYDPNTGEITGRITCSTGQAQHYPVKREVSDAEFDERPELFQKVNIADIDAPLVALSEDEARKKGAPEEFIAEKINSRKMERKDGGEKRG